MSIFSLSNSTLAELQQINFLLVTLAFNMQYCKTLLGKSDVTYCSKNKCLFYQGGSTTVLHSLAMTSYGRPSVSSTYVLVHCAI